MGAFVIKVGGDVADDRERSLALANEIARLCDGGARVVLLHGGGPQVNRLQAALGLEPVKVGGRRVTRAEDLVVVEQAIVGEVNVALCSALIASGVRAFGCHGASGTTIVARKRPPRQVTGADAPVDFGEVGDVDKIDTRGLIALLDAGLVPVVATLGIAPDTGRVFNINADTTAVRVAAALQASLVMVTAVGGVYRDLDDKDSRVEAVDAQGARALIDDGVIQGGMIPKIEEALSVIDQVGAVLIAAPDAIFAAQEGRAGTRITP